MLQFSLGIGQEVDTRMNTTTYAVVDLETTGHSSSKGDRIIQIAIVFIEHMAITKTYTTFVNPGKEIPAFIKQLTNISEEDVADAPRFEDIAEKVAEMLQGAVFVAHNTDFDLNFLQREFSRCGVRPWKGKKIDTVELAKIVYPSSHGYRLQDLTDELHIPLTAAHRADDDAKATAELFLRAYDKLRTLPKETLQLLHRRSFSLKSDVASVFYDAIKRCTSADLYALFRGIPYKKETTTSSLTNHVIAYPTTSEEKKQLLQKVYARYEEREAQSSFMDIVWGAFQNRQEAIAEVPTGVGKTMAYLLPAFLYAVEKRQPVVISTYTNHLIDKIVLEEVAALRAVFDGDLLVTVLKGRAQYISFKKFEELLQITDESYDETLAIMQILVWLTETTTGDLEELNVSGGGQLFIDRIRKRSHAVAEDERQADFHLRNIERATHSHMIVTNHSMLLTDVKRESSIFPQISGIIIDEAHQFIPTAYQTSELIFSYTNWKYVFGQLSSDANGQLLQQIEVLQRQYNCENERLKQALMQAYERFIVLFDEVAYALCIIPQKRKSGNYYTYTLEDVSIDQTTYAAVANCLYTYIELVEQYGALVKSYNAQMTKKEQALVEEWHYWLEEIKMKAGDWVELFLDTPSQNRTVWIETDRRSIPGSLTIIRSFVEGAPIIRQFTSFMAEQNIGIVWTSGTLTVQSDERFIASQLGIQPSTTVHQLEAPADFYKGAEIIVVDNMPDIQHVSQDEYIEAVADAIIQTVMSLGGRLFVLFTAQDMLRKTYELVWESGLLEEYALLAQGVSSGSRFKLLKSFRQFEKSVLFGTNSFWEGVDVPGEALAAVIVVRLPFSSPDEPIFKARATNLTATGVNSFTKLSLPEAIMRLRQGFGRLIRSSQDKGYFIILDRRIETKSYGEQFIQSLPPVPVKKVLLENMVNELEN